MLRIADDNSSGNAVAVPEKVNVARNQYGQVRITFPHMTKEEEKALADALGTELVDARAYRVCSEGLPRFGVTLGDRKARFDFLAETEEEKRILAVRENDPKLQAIFYPRVGSDDPELFLP